MNEATEHRAVRRYGSVTSNLLRRTRRGLLTAGAAATLAAASGLLAPAPALAVGCYGDYCSGKDPDQTGCSAGAYTTASARIPGTNATVDLRWSPTCKTNWTRTNWYPDPSTTTISAVQCPTGYTQRGTSGSADGYYWTKMIYSPKMGVSARFTGSPGSTATSCS